MKTKQCEKCKMDLPLNQFHAHHKAADGRMNKCIKCWNKRPRTTKRGYARVSFTAKESNDPRFKVLLMRHGYSTACFYQRMLVAGWAPDQAKILAETAYSDNDRYGRLRRQLGVRLRF